jgi:DNA-binding transcriptional LysR family regulator
MIDIRSLRYLVILARRLSYARAAEDLGISQPALTRTVQNLEGQFGVRLFDRDRTGVRLTSEGREMLDAAAVLVSHAEDLERQWERTARGQEGVVRFGMAPLPARSLLATTLLKRLGTAARVRNEVVVRSVDALWPLLVSGEIEFFVAAAGQIPDTPPVRAETLGSFPLSYIVRAGHPLLHMRGSDRRFPVLVSSRIALLLPTDLQMHAEGLPHVIEDFDVLARLTAQTDAIWATSTHAVVGEVRSGALCELTRAKHAPQQELRMMIYSLLRRTRSTFAKSLIQVLREEINALASASDDRRSG